MWYFWSTNTTEPIANYINAIEKSDLNQLKRLCQKQTVDFETIRSWSIVDKRCFGNSLNLLQLALRHQSTTKDIVNYLVDTVRFQLDLSALMVAIRYGNVQGLTILFQKHEIRDAYIQQLQENPHDINDMLNIMDDQIKASIKAKIQTILEQYAPKPTDLHTVPPIANLYFMWARLKQQESQYESSTRAETIDNDANTQKSETTRTGCILS